MHYPQYSADLTQETNIQNPIRVDNSGDLELVQFSDMFPQGEILTDETIIKDVPWKILKPIAMDKGAGEATQKYKTTAEYKSLSFVQKYKVDELIKAQRAQGNMGPLQPTVIEKFKMNFEKQSYINHIERMRTIKDGNHRMINRTVSKEE